MGTTFAIYDLAALPARLEQAKRLDPQLRLRPVRPLGDAEAIAYVKALDVKRLDKGLSSRPLAGWLEELAGPDSSVSWFLRRCGGGRPGVRSCEETRACVVGRFESPQAEVWVEVEVGTYRRGIFGTPGLQMVHFFNPKEGTQKFGTYPLRELPIALGEVRD